MTSAFAPDMVFTLSHAKWFYSAEQDIYGLTS